jgi:hypothetical protein
MTARQWLAELHLYGYGACQTNAVYLRLSRSFL